MKYFHEDWPRDEHYLWCGVFFLTDELCQPDQDCFFRQAAIHVAMLLLTVEAVEGDCGRQVASYF